MRILLIILFSFLYLTPFVYAKTSSDQRMIIDFRKAVFSKDQDKIHTTWMKLWANDDVVKYMEKNMPDEYLLYKYHRLVMRADEMKKKYSGGSLSSSQSEGSSRATSGSEKSGTGGSNNLNNRGVVFKNLNKNRIPNRVKGRTSVNPRTSNPRFMRGSVDDGRRTRKTSNNKRYQRRPNSNRVR